MSGTKLIILFPMGFVIGILVFSILKGQPNPIRIAGSFAAVLGPISILPTVFFFRRASIDLCIILSVILLLSQAKSNDKTFTPIIYVASCIILWFNHYTSWPFLAVLIFIHSILSKSENRYSIPSAALAVFTPIILYPNPFFAATPYLTRIFTDGFSEIIKSALTLFGGRLAVPQSGIQVSGAASPQPSWLPELSILLLAISLMVMGLMVVYLILISNESPESSYKPNFIQFFGQNPLLLSVSIAFSATTFIYLVAGYLTRVFIFLPVLTPILIVGVCNQLKSLDSTQRSDISTYTHHILIFLLIVMIISHGIPALYPSFNKADERASFSSSYQTQSADFSQYIQGDITTDLNHANILVLSDISPNRIHVGAAVAIPGNKRVLTSEASPLFVDDIDQKHAVLATYSGSGTVLWGASIETSPKPSSRQSNVVYTNGQDYWLGDV
ncbi:hypothetical protein [Haloferax volcanii]|uniref:hypothetical protein n=1 Tax=Haloferax volcanii TaxID=2246 RepID=UPI0012672829|nr:hypothetical protein [Haloferax lucentense]